MKVEKIWAWRCAKCTRLNITVKDHAPTVCEAPPCNGQEFDHVELRKEPGP